MIELDSDQLVFRFPDLRVLLKERARGWIDARVWTAKTDEKRRLPSSRDALYAEFDDCVPRVRAAVSFQRTLRIPDDGRDYPLPPGLGRFPVRHVDDFANVPETWKKRGGVMLPMHKTEALWLNFDADYPVALKIGAGGICAISGERWSPSLSATQQNYVVLPEQPWLDGFRVSEGVIRQFVAVPLGKGLTVEHQFTGEESWGGLQLQVFPMKSERYSSESMISKLEWKWRMLVSPPVTFLPARKSSVQPCCCVHEAGMGAGGRIKQKIAYDPNGTGGWDMARTVRCYAHLCLSQDWQRMTGALPPHQAPTAADYTNAGLPWFNYDAGEQSVKGETVLSGVKSVGSLVDKKTGLELPNNETVLPENIVVLKHN